MDQVADCGIGERGCVHNAWGTGGHAAKPSCSRESQAVHRLQVWLDLDPGGGRLLDMKVCDLCLLRCSYDSALLHSLNWMKP